MMKASFYIRMSEMNAALGRDTNICNIITGTVDWCHFSFVTTDVWNRDGRLVAYRVTVSQEYPNRTETTYNNGEFQVFE